MILRKINAGISLLTTVLTLGHAITTSVWMLSGGSISASIGFVPWVVVGLMACHAFISIDLAISGHEGAEKRKCRSYPGKNIPTLIQRASGILLIVFTGLHIAGATHVMQPPPVIHAIVPPLFFVVVLVHVAVSTSKAFITLGIGNVAFVKFIDILVKILCIAVLIADIIGFYLYLC